MDYINSYGVRLLMPFSDRWFYGDALYIVDPWLYLMLGPRLVARRRDAAARRRASASRWRRSTCSRCSTRTSWRAAKCASGLARAGRRADTRFMVTPVFVNPLQPRSRHRPRRSLREGQSLVRSAAAFPARRVRHVERDSISRQRSRRCSRRGPGPFCVVAVPVRRRSIPRGPPASGSTTIATRTPARTAGRRRQASVSHR